ncbi:glycosyltransferase family 4 protein [Thermomonas hydrothermalis]|uniref:Glycosyltransferase involved in cell wall bisynthesis n=1 Tax=Thermomonas hydrothermalis TaxID=213588 RepID=A0A1M4U7X5_9GAMM|nr:glycosyltransferase family 4 protein [Thermomonas hydrothermalis]SHE52697.1 Glycosyltransferase involved in cell wall bisynthesis [Thermomonas hydrothermalis]
MKFVYYSNTDWYLWNFRRSLVLALRNAGHDVLLISPDGPYGEKLRGLGVRWQPVPMERRSLNPLRELALLWYLVRLLRREQPDLVHGFTIKCAVYGALAARLAGVPVRVSAVAGLGYVFISDSFLARSLRPLVRVLLKVALGGRNARLILQNPDDVALFQRAELVDPSRIRLIPGSGVDTIRFAPDPERMPGPRIRVLLAARLLWDKGLAEYVQAARLLHARQVPVELLLAGDPDPGNPAAVPEAEVHGWVNQGLLQWLGHVDDMPALFRSVDIVSLPSYREGLPKSLIEAGACGCALIATQVPGCQDVICHGVDGLLVPPRDGVALADAIERLVQDGQLRARLAVAAREKALALFDERIVIARTLDVYHELLGRPVG